jgi:hypothetical protein
MSFTETDGTKDKGRRALAMLSFISLGCSFPSGPAGIITLVVMEGIDNQPEAGEVGAGSHARIDGTARVSAARGAAQLFPKHSNREYGRRDA